MFPRRLPLFVAAMTNYQTPEELAEAIEEGTRRKFYVGLDLGQTHDFTAVCVIEKQEKPILHLGWRAPAPVSYSLAYRVRHLERLALGTPYTGIVSHVRTLLHTHPLQNADLIVDETGVGRPVVDMFKAAKMRPIPVTITGGDSWSRSDGSFRVSKLMLVSRLQAAVHSGLLHIAPTEPDGAVLRAELADFQPTHTPNGYIQYGARSGRHDDLVLATAIALWHAATIGNQKMQKARTRL